jgi:hypothetical protein
MNVAEVRERAGSSAQRSPALASCYARCHNRDTDPEHKRQQNLPNEFAPRVSASHSGAERGATIKK